jgi:glycerol-3-phosphate acyltransferase PlsY
MLLHIVVASLCAYLLGNLNGAVSMSMLRNDDVRSHGSGNAGLTNFIRNYGAASSVFVILIDMSKAILACLLGGLLLEPYGYYTEGTALGGLFVILGHDFPALLGFKGGKGILSGVTVALMLDWRLGLLVFGIFLVAYLLTQYVSLGSVLSAGSFGFFYAVFHRDSLFPILVSFFLSGLIVWMHRANIVRLIKGEERKTNLLAKGKKA